MVPYLTPDYFRVPFSGVGHRYSEAEKAVVLAAMDSATSLTQGSHLRAFEEKFRQFIGVSHVFATSSAAAALELAAILAGLKPGDEVICPAHTYCASAYPFARHGVQLKWADIERDTFVVSAESVRSLVSDKTKAIIAVHLYGLPADVVALREIADGARALLIEDCAQAIGAKFGGIPVGSFGDFSVFSFQSHKNVSTLGEGGMLSVRDAELAQLVPGLRHNGHAPFDRTDDRYWYPAMSDVKFDIEGVWPHNFCLGEPQCALGVALLDRVEEVNEVRRSRYFRAIDVLGSFSELHFQGIPSGRVSAHHLLPFKYGGQHFGACNHDFMERLVVEHRIQPATQYYPLYRYKLFSHSGNSQADVPVTDDFFDNMVSLPFHSWMSDEDFEYLLSSVVETAEFLRVNGGHWQATGA